MFMWWHIRRFRNAPADFRRVDDIARYGRRAVPCLLGMLGECFDESNDFVAENSGLAKGVVRALEIIGDPATQKPLIRLLRHARGDLATAAGRTLRKIGWAPTKVDDRVFLAYYAYRHSKEQGERLKEVVDSAGRAAVPGLLQLLERDPDDSWVWSVVGFLGHLKDARARPALLKHAMKAMDPFTVASLAKLPPNADTVKAVVVIWGTNQPQAAHVGGPDYHRKLERNKHFLDAMRPLAALGPKPFLSGLEAWNAELNSMSHSGRVQQGFNSHAVADILIGLDLARAAAADLVRLYLNTEWGRAFRKAIVAAGPAATPHLLTRLQARKRPEGEGFSLNEFLMWEADLRSLLGELGWKPNGAPDQGAREV